MTVLRTPPGRTGFSLAELAVLLAVIGVICSLSLPAWIRFHHASQVQGAAAEIAAYMNQARQIAIQRNQSVCMHITAAAVHYHLGSCGSGPLWLGPGTDGSGNIPTPVGVTLASTADPVFTNLGAAAPAATVTVANARASLSVVVSASGRVSVTR